MEECSSSSLSSEETLFRSDETPSRLEERELVVAEKAIYLWHSRNRANERIEIGFGFHDHVLLTVVGDEQFPLHHLPGKTPAKIEEGVVVRQRLAGRQGEKHLVLLDGNGRQLGVNRNRGENGRDGKRGEIEQVRFVLEVERNVAIAGLERLDADDDEDSLEGRKNQRIGH